MPKNQQKCLDEIILFHQQNRGMARLEKFTYIYENILGKKLSQNESNKLNEEFLSLVYHQILKCPFVPGAKEVLQQYFSQIPLFIISNTTSC